MGQTVSNRSSDKAKGRAKKKFRIRKKMAGTTERPRLSIFKSLRYMAAQVVDDTTGKTVVAATTKTMSLKSRANREAAAALGKEMARLLGEKNIKKVVFDRNGYLFHGRVKAVADAAREAGLEF